MRRAALVVALACVAGAAHADDARAKLGFRIGFGELPLDGMRTETLSIGLGVEHPAFCHFRLFGDYEWMWLVRGSTSTMPADSGNGQRVNVGLRHVLLDHRVGGDLRLYLDGELGGGFMLGSDSAGGVHALPDALAGVRFGYELRAPRSSSSRRLEAEFVVRALAIPHGGGVLAGVGATWD